MYSNWSTRDKMVKAVTQHEGTQVAVFHSATFYIVLESL